MKHSIILTFILSTILISCSENDRNGFNFIIFNTHATDALVEDILIENNKIIYLLDSLNPSTTLAIGKVRDESLQEISDIKESLLAYCGGRDPETAAFMTPLERSKVVKYFIELNNGLKLKKSINKIVVYVNQQGGNETYIARDMDGVLNVPRNPLYNKTFSELYFDNSTLTGALNTITIFEGYIVQFENAYLNGLLREEVLNGL